MICEATLGIVETSIEAHHGLTSHGYCPRCLIVQHIALGMEEIRLAPVEVERG
jgi:hypothetical protein